MSIISKIASFYHTPADQLTIDQIRDFILRRITVDHLSKPWMNAAISAVKLLYCEVLKREWNLLDLPRPRSDKKVPVILSRDEVQRNLSIIKKVDVEGNPDGYLFRWITAQ